MSPRRIAEEVAKRLALSGSYFSEAEIAGPGFINLRLSPLWYQTVLSAIQKEGALYGSVDEGQGKRVNVEFVSANPTGTMSIGNARGGVLGDSIASVLERAGWDVTREFYINDAGHQVEMLGISLEARYIQYYKGEDAAAFPDDGYHGDDVRELAAEFAAEFGEKYLDADSEERRKALTEFGLRRNIARMHADLEKYKVSYDVWFNESQLHDSGYVKQTMDLLESRGHLYEKDGAKWFRATDFGCEKDEVMIKSNGFYTYYAADVAYHRNKFEKRRFDRAIDVLGADHHGHSLRFQAGVRALGIEPERLDFVLYQLVRFTRDGETVRMSKRTGKTITLSDLLDEIPVDAARFFFNLRQADTHLEFDMDLAIRQDSENPVYYVQYAHARIHSLIRNLEAEGHNVPDAGDTDFSLLDTPVEKQLIKALAQYPEEIRLAARDLEPARINRYLIDLASAFHSFYSANRIKDAEPKVLSARLKLADSVRAVLKNGLELLSVGAPEKM